MRSTKRIDSDVDNAEAAVGRLTSFDDGAQAMCDEDACARFVLQERVDIAHQLRFRVCVERGCLQRLISFHTQRREWRVDRPLRRRTVLADP